MKKILVLICMLFVAQTIFATQWWLGGNLGIDYSKVEDESFTAYYIKPEVGYNLDDDWDIGVNFGISYEKAKLYGLQDKITTYGIEPFVRYSIFFIDDFTFYLKGSIFYRSSEFKDNKITPNTFGLSVVPVVCYRIDDNWSINAELTFLELDFVHAQQNDFKYTEFGLNVNSGAIVNIGFTYHF